MKLSKIILGFLGMVIILLFLFQVVLSFYSEDNLFRDEVKNQLISSVEIKSERINDYFIESKNNIEILGDSEEVRSMFYNERYSDELILSSNINKKLDVLVNQLNLFFARSSDKNIEDLMMDNSFVDLAIQKIGINGNTSLVDLSTGQIILGEGGDYVFEKKVNINPFDGKFILLRANVDYEDYSMIKNFSSNQIEYLDRYFDVFDYTNMFLISSEGNVIYERRSFDNLGEYVLSSYYDDYLGEIYLNAKNIRYPFAFGPYREIGEKDSVLYFVYPYYEDDIFVGVVVVEDSIDFVESIVSEKVINMNNSRMYLIDSEDYLITSLMNYDTLIQEIKTENSRNCFENSGVGFNEFLAFDGERVLSVYSKVPEFNWCLFSEVPSDEILSISKGDFYKEILYSVFFILIFSGLSYFIFRKFNYNVKFIKKTNDIKNVPSYLAILVSFIVLFVEYLINPDFLFSFNGILSNLILVSLLFLVVIFSKIKDSYSRIIIVYGFFILAFIQLVLLFLDRTFMYGYAVVVLNFVMLCDIVFLLYGFVSLGGKK